MEGESVKARLGDFLFGRVCELQFEPRQEVEVHIFDVVVDGVQLFEALKDAFNPSIYLGSFDEHKCDCDVPYQGFKARYSLVSHHVDLEFSNGCVGSGSVSIEEEWGNAGWFKVSSGLYGNKMSGGYSTWCVWSFKGISRTSRTSRTSWTSRTS